MIVILKARKLMDDSYEFEAWLDDTKTDENGNPDPAWLYAEVWPPYHEERLNLPQEIYESDIQSQFRRLAENERDRRVEIVTGSKKKTESTLSLEGQKFS